MAAQDPERSISAMAGSATHSSAARLRLNLLKVMLGLLAFLIYRLPLGRACRRIPFGIARLFLVLRSDHKGLAQIGWVGGDDGDHNQRIAVGLFDHVEVFRERGFVAIRNTVLAQETGPEVGCGDFERSIRSPAPAAYPL